MDDAHAERLVSKAASAAHLTATSSASIQTLHAASLFQRARLESKQDDTYLSLAPTFVSLHQQASLSKQLLSSLESFLSSFQSDLSTLSTQISALQTTSHHIDSRLDATRDVEMQLAQFLAHIALSPRIVDLFFDSEPDARPELWFKAVKQLERVLEATRPNAQLPLLSPHNGSANDVAAVAQVRAVAEACKNIVASKLRSYLVLPHATIRSSVTTNLQVLQTSVLLRHHKPMYAFLARQMPRVAIDVQRSYVGAARLYFETAFRRYTRSLGVVRKRWVESTGSAELITDPPSTKPIDIATTISSLHTGMAALATATSTTSSLYPPPRPAGSTPWPNAQDPTDTDAMSTDGWLFPTARLQYAHLSSSSSTVLGYLADDSQYRACPENLFRSLSLVLMDNACSEYTFLVRFFEGVGAQEEDASVESRQQKGSVASASAGMDGEESASVNAEAVDGDERGPEASVVQLSGVEQKQMQGRGASDEIFKQIFEPCVSTWTRFAKTMVSPAASTGSVLAASASSVVSGSSGASASTSIATSASGYFSLLTMIQLNERILSTLHSRGCCSALLDSALMRFKIDCYPQVKRFLDDQINALSHLSSPSSAVSTGRMWSVLSNLSSSSPPTQLTSSFASTLVIRYASLITKTLWVLHDSADQPILSSLIRLRSELATLITTHKLSESWSKHDRLTAVQTLIHAVEAITSAASTASCFSSHAKIQNEFSFWNDVLVSLRA